MKKLIFTFISLFTMFTCQAQLKAGSIAPNVILTDLDGVSHNLYDYLDSGVTVVFDIFATWCGPCKKFRNSHVFEALDLHYGMHGNILPRKIKVFSIEGDPTTSRDDLMSYATGYDYSYIEYDRFGSIYPAPNIPKFYVICPNRVISYAEAGISTDVFKESFWVAYMDNCPNVASNNRELNVLNGLKVSPNPASNFINIQFELPSIQPFSLHLIDITGKTVLCHEVNPPETLINASLPIDDLNPGFYTLQIIHQGNTYNAKVVIAP